MRLWQSSGHAAEKTAGELGISVFNLYKWKQEELQVEVERLQRELARMTEQRDILKKAAGILSEPSPSGMPGFKR